MIDLAYVRALGTAGYACEAICEERDDEITAVRVADPVMCMSGCKVWRELRYVNLRTNSEVDKFICERS